MDSKFEIKILKDSKKRDTDVNAMSLEVAKAFVVLVDSVTGIVENTPDNNDLTINIEQGSVRLLVEGNGVERLQKNFIDVITVGSVDKPLVESWRNMQSLFKKNGLTYEATISTKEKKTRVYEALKDHDKLRAKPAKRQIPKTNIEFIEGTLVELGGINPNMHIDVGRKNRIKISCTHENANKAKEYLFKTILVSTWSKKKGAKTEYDFCDSYVVSPESSFYKFKKFINDFETTGDELDSLDLLYNQVNDYLKDGKISRLKRFLKLFLHTSTDVNTLHTLMLVMQYLKENSELSFYAKQIEYFFDEKVNQLTRTEKRQSVRY